MSSLLQVLGYNSSSNFLNAEAAADHGASFFSHVCRVGKLRLGLQGVYTLGAHTATPTPVVAVYRADSDEEAREIHRLVWNQDFVPFLIVDSPSTIRLYSGFEYAEPEKQDSNTGLIEPIRDFNRISEFLTGFHADEIDDGTLWSKWGQHVSPERRVDWDLLANLKKLEKKLRSQGLPRAISHSLIGRYVYLRYLKDRSFLSKRKLSRWGLQEEQIFSREANIKAFSKLNINLDDETDGLNGCIFPFDLRDISQDHLTSVAGAFCGDDPETGQRVFEFAAYDFAYIPVETLSVVYEQFLHEPESNSNQDQISRSTSRGYEEGAYYTPVPLVNFVLAEMDAKKRLVPGMKILDPACGSGAFLVQAFRMLIERAIRTSNGNTIPPSELRSILTTQIFGVDRDPEACRIAEMSLLITLLDYVNPPDLEGKYHNFRLPKLSQSNIFEADFFDSQSNWQLSLQDKASPAPFDWIVGNPPWKEIKKPPKDPRDQPALDYVLAKDTPPVGGNQIAEAFVWKSQEVLRQGGITGLVLPAMTLFKEESSAFRKELFANTDVWHVVNFANLAYVLFAGRTKVPVMSLFFRKPEDDKRHNNPILTFAPFVVNQEANRPMKAGKQLETWNVIVNGSEIREVSPTDAATGDGLIWKLAMWGSPLDRKLLRRIAGKFPTLEAFCEQNVLQNSQGLELRSDPVGLSIVQNGPDLLVKDVAVHGPAEKAGVQVDDQITMIAGRDAKVMSFEEAVELLRGKEGELRSVKREEENGVTKIELHFGGEKLEHHPELEGKLQPVFKLLKECGRIVDFSDRVLKPIERSRCWIREGRADLPMSISSPPHLIIDASRRFSIFRSDFVAVPARQIGISGSEPKQEDLFRALAIYLNSDFMFYHQFYETSEMGIQKSRSTLQTLRKIPVPPLSRYSQEWANFHRDLQKRTAPDKSITSADQAHINELVSEALGLRHDEQHLIEDFVHVNLLMIQGKVEQEAIRAPNGPEITSYLSTLRDQLDAYMEDESAPASHHITAVLDAKSAMIEIVLCEGKPVPPVFREADSAESAEFNKTRKHLLEKHRQWIYFDRSLQIYSKGRLHLFKPLQHVQWTRRQAILDAGELIAEALGTSSI